MWIPAVDFVVLQEWSHAEATFELMYHVNGASCSLNPFSDVFFASGR